MKTQRKTQSPAVTEHSRGCPAKVRGLIACTCGGPPVVGSHSVERDRIAELEARFAEARKIIEAVALADASDRFGEPKIDTPEGWRYLHEAARLWLVKNGGGR